MRLGAGDSLCASGSQVCMGARPALVPYPTITRRNEMSNRGGYTFGAAWCSALQVIA